jgi:Rod binding domain-containing protein
MHSIAAQSIGASTAGRQAEMKLRGAADRLVGSVFYGTLLRQMRNSSLKGEYGHGGRGEEVFAAQLDHYLAQEAGRARGTPLSDAIVRRYSGQAEVIERFNEDRRQRLDDLQREVQVRANDAREA